MNKNFIYALKCPLTDEIKYVGQTTKGIDRPLEHIINKSHSEKVNLWVNELGGIGLSPHIIILERDLYKRDINSREIYWIHYYIKAGHKLLNVSHYDFTISSEKEQYPSLGTNILSKFVKEQRKKINLTQEEFANASGIALTVIRKIEQGKTNLNMDKVIKCVTYLGGSIGIRMNS